MGTKYDNGVDFDISGCEESLHVFKTAKLNKLYAAKKANSDKLYDDEYAAIEDRIVALNNITTAQGHTLASRTKGVLLGAFYAQAAIIVGGLAMLLTCLIAYWANNMGWYATVEQKELFINVGLVFGLFALLHAIFGRKWAIIVLCSLFALPVISWVCLMVG